MKRIKSLLFCIFCSSMFLTFFEVGAMHGGFSRVNDRPDDPPADWKERIEGFYSQPVSLPTFSVYRDDEGILLENQSVLQENELASSQSEVSLMSGLQSSVGSFEASPEPLDSGEDVLNLFEGWSLREADELTSNGSLSPMGGSEFNLEILDSRGGVSSLAQDYDFATTSISLRRGGPAFFEGLSESSRSTERRTAFGVAQVRGPSRLQNEIIRHSFSLARAISAIGLRGVSYPS